MDDIDISITPYQMTPLNAVTKPFINQLKSFNEYTEKSQNTSSMQRPMARSGHSKYQQRSLGDHKVAPNMLEGISEDGPNETSLQ